MHKQHLNYSRTVYSGYSLTTDGHFISSVLLSDGDLSVPDTIFLTERDFTVEESVSLPWHMAGASMHIFLSTGISAEYTA